MPRFASETFTSRISSSFYGIQRLNQISNIDIAPQAFDPDGMPVEDLDEKFTFFRKDIRRSVAKGWCFRCKDRLLPALRSVATVEQCNALIDLMHARLLDAEKDFPHDSEMAYKNSLMKGDSEMERGNLNAARESYERARGSAQPESADFAIACDKVGDVARALGQFRQARTFYEQALPLFRRLAAGQFEHRRDLSLCLSKLGELALSEDNIATADPFLKEHLTMAHEIAASDTANQNYQRDLAGAHARLQRLAQESGDRRGAFHHANEARKIVQHLAELDPGNVTNIQDLAGASYMYGIGLASMGENSQAIQVLRESAAIAKALAGKGQLDAKGRFLLFGLTNELFKVGESEEAADVACLATEALSLAPQDPVAKQFSSVCLTMLDKLLDQQRNETAEKLCDKMLPLCMKIHGGHSPEMAVLLNISGILRKRRNDLEGAERFYRLAYDAICRLQGPQSPGAIAGYQNLMWVVKKRQEAAAGSATQNKLLLKWCRHRAHQGSILAIRHCAATGVVATGGMDQMLKVWSLECEQPLHVFKAHNQALTGLALTTGGTQIVSCSWDRHAKLWQRDGKLVHALEISGSDLCAVALAPNKRSVFIACEDGSIQKWDIDRNQLVHMGRLHQQAVMSLAVDNMGRLGVSGGNDGVLRTPLEFSKPLASRFVVGRSHQQILLTDIKCFRAWRLFHAFLFGAERNPIRCPGF